MEIRRRLVPGVLIGGLVLAGGGSVIAASGGSSSTHSAANQQYCPPNSPGAGGPPPCGNPPPCPPASPNPGGRQPCGKQPDDVGIPIGVGLPGGGNGNGNPQGPPEHGSKNGKKKKGKKARFHVKRAKAKRCYARSFTLRVNVVNRGHGARTTVARDGRRIKKSGRNSFTIRLDVSKLKRGVHKLTLKVRGKDGKMHTRTVSFRRC